MARPLKFVDPGELLAELDALGGNPFNIVMRHSLGLSPLDVDSDRCSGKEARRCPTAVVVVTAEAACNSDALPKLGNGYRSVAGAA